VGEWYPLRHRIAERHVQRFNSLRLAAWHLRLRAVVCAKDFSMAYYQTFTAKNQKTLDD
jgi:hypothetical protein